MTSLNTGNAATVTKEVTMCVPQVCTGDGWAQSIARPLVGNSDLFPAPATAAASAMAANSSAGGESDVPVINRWVAVYFMSFYFMTCICLIGVVHAILLDEFMISMQVRCGARGGRRSIGDTDRDAHDS